MNTREAILILLVFVSCRGRARAQGTLVFNGGFATNTDGWILANGAGFEFTNGNPAGDVALGSIPPSDTTDPTASQTINSLTPGTAYLVSGDLRYLTDRGGGSPTDFGFGVMVDGAVLFESAQRTSVVSDGGMEPSATSPAGLPLVNSNPAPLASIHPSVLVAKPPLKTRVPWARALPLHETNTNRMRMASRVFMSHLLGSNGIGQGSGPCGSPSRKKKRYRPETGLLILL